MSSKALANRMTEQSNLMIDTLTSASFNEGGRIITDKVVWRGSSVYVK
jgi:hypothetical protein